MIRTQVRWCRVGTPPPPGPNASPCLIVTRPRQPRSSGPPVLRRTPCQRRSAHSRRPLEAARSCSRPAERTVAQQRRDNSRRCMTHGGDGPKPVGRAAQRRGSTDNARHPSGKPTAPCRGKIPPQARRRRDDPAQRSSRRASSQGIVDAGDVGVQRRQRARRLRSLDVDGTARRTTFSGPPQVAKLCVRPSSTQAWAPRSGAGSRRRCGQRSAWPRTRPTTRPTAG